MADMNYWNELQQRRGAEAALLRLRYDVSGIAAGAFVGDKVKADVIHMIDQHIATYSK